jgi:methyltransferase (TIGR00027 family)
VRNEPSRTAEAVCLFRASDQRRPPDARIVDDPYARWFLGPLFRAALTALEVTGRLGELAEEYSPGLMAYVLARHRFIDDALVAALSQGRAEQVVVLGAGYDTRAQRFADRLNGRRVFELDFPATSRRKGQILAERSKELPQVDLQRVEIDFLTQKIEDVLDQAGFVRGAPTFFVWEGVSMYLTRNAVKGTLSTIRDLGGPGSELAMDFWYLLDDHSLLAAAHRAGANLLHLLGEPITFGIHPEDVGWFLERIGLDLIECVEAKELESRYVKDERSIYPGTYLIRARPI